MGGFFNSGCFNSGCFNLGYQHEGDRMRSLRVLVNCKWLYAFIKVWLWCGTSE